jgi:hypothetical protein
MNRLVLIGNGFDLAHGLKTSYRDFIYWYMNKCFHEANSNGSYEDDLIVINRNLYYHDLKKLDSYIESYLKNFNSKKKIGSITYSFQEDRRPTEVFTIRFKTELLESLLDRCKEARWVDIESEYYNLLKPVLEMKKEPEKEPYLHKLNTSLCNLIKHLEAYLKEVEVGETTYIEPYEGIFKSRVLADDLYPKGKHGDQFPNEIRFLNFNYTNTVHQYALSTPNSTVTVSYIHGKLGDNANKLVFGFGDELDQRYKQMEDDSSTEGYFEYIKSFWYLRTSNYRELVDFLDANEYQVYVLGHSCGLSDRTMLQMIFEHQHCKSVKIYYHEKKGVDNYVSITHNIARHFTNKDMMRKKIVSKDRSLRMPQFDDQK